MDVTSACGGCSLLLRCQGSEDSLSIGNTEIADHCLNSVAVDYFFQSDVFKNEFNGMTFDPIRLDQLQAVAALMVNSLKAQFTQSDFDFLYSFKSGEPNLEIAPHQQIQHLPAVQWKLLNINKMSVAKRARSLALLKATMDDWLTAHSNKEEP